MSNNKDDDNVSTILMVIGLFTVLYWLFKFLETDFGGSLLLLIILVPPLIYFIYALFFDKEISFFDRLGLFFMAALFGSVIYIVFL